MVAVDVETTARGAKVVVEKCLAPAPHERVHLLSFRAGALTRVLERAVREAGAEAVRVELDDMDKDETVADYMAKLAPLMVGATAIIALAPSARPPQTLSLAMAKTAEGQKARMLYLLQVDERLLAQGARAEPELLQTVNERVMKAIKPPCTVRVTSETGTDLEISLSAHHPLLSAAGKPKPGQSENLPAGYVYVHPARVSGTLVVDRAIFGPKGEVDRALLRRSGPKVEFVAGRIHHHDAKDPAIAAVLDRYLESHTFAGRVGLAVLPTNYLVRSEIGSDRQDMLLPGVTISLGFANQDATLATYEAPVQLVLLGRKQTVEVGGRALIEAGRFASTLVEGIDPFR